MILQATITRKCVDLDSCNVHEYKVAELKDLCIRSPRGTLLHINTIAPKSTHTFLNLEDLIQIISFILITERLN